MEIHSKTKIGPLVNQIKKEGGSGNVQSLAKSLLGKWKKVQAAQQGKALSAPNASSGGGEKEKQPSSASIDVDTKQDDVADNDNSNVRSLPETRLKIYEKIKTVLVDGKAEETIASALAESIEHAMNEKSPFSQNNNEKKKEYLTRARELIFNVKNNEVIYISTHRPSFLRAIYNFALFRPSTYDYIH